MNEESKVRASLKEDQSQQRPNTYSHESSSSMARRNRVPVKAGSSSSPPTKYRCCYGSENAGDQSAGGVCGGALIACKKSYSSSSNGSGKTTSGVGAAAAVPEPVAAGIRASTASRPPRKILADKTSTCNSVTSNNTKRNPCISSSSSSATSASSSSTSTQQNQNFFASILGFSPNEFLPLRETIQRYHQESSPAVPEELPQQEGPTACNMSSDVTAPSMPTISPLILDINHLSDDALGTCFFSGFLDSFETARLTLVCRRIRHLAHEKVQKLDLRQCTNLTPQHLETIVSSYYNLTTLDFSYCTQFQYDHLIKILPLTNTLQHLCMKGTKVDDDAIVRYFEQMKKLPPLSSPSSCLHRPMARKSRLQSLDVSAVKKKGSTKIGNDAAKAIAMNCPELRTLRMAWCSNVTDEGASCLLQSLSHCLEVLDLSLTGISNCCHAPISAAPSLASMHSHTEAHGNGDTASHDADGDSRHITSSAMSTPWTCRKRCRSALHSGFVSTRPGKYCLRALDVSATHIADDDGNDGTDFHRNENQAVGEDSSIKRRSLSSLEQMISSLAARGGVQQLHLRFLPSLTPSLVERIVRRMPGLEFLDVTHSGEDGNIQISTSLARTIIRKGILTKGLSVVAPVKDVQPSRQEEAYQPLSNDLSDATSSPIASRSQSANTTSTKKTTTSNILQRDDLYPFVYGLMKQEVKQVRLNVLPKITPTLARRLLHQRASGLQGLEHNFNGILIGSSSCGGVTQPMFGSNGSVEETLVNISPSLATSLANTGYLLGGQVILETEQNQLPNLKQTPALNTTANTTTDPPSKSHHNHPVNQQPKQQTHNFYGKNVALLLCLLQQGNILFY